jgi:ubiquinone/menaquinone biosynthesis C-methylase UbiE
MIVIVLFGFFYNFHFTFKNVKDKGNKFIIYTISLILFTVVDILFVKILTDDLRIYYLLSIIISTTILFALKFLFYRRFVFIDYKEKGGNYFDKHGSKNPFIKYLMNQFHNVLFVLINKINIKTLLDVGCGEGSTTSTIQKKFPKINIKAIEFDDSTIEKANEINSGLKVEKGDIYNINFKDHCFDVVLSSEVLEHLEYPEKAIKECKRVSNKYCIFSVPNEPWWRISNILRLSYLPRLGNTPGHIQHWTKKGFRRLLKKHFKHVVIKNSILWNFALCWD